MPTVLTPFAGLRYNPRLVPDPRLVLTPPYDVVSEDERIASLARSPYSMMHLILGDEFPDDTARHNRFTRAAALLQQWRQQGVMRQEARPALYVYEQAFELGATVAMGGERLPQKSTYFYPKLPTGLVVNGFEL